MMHFGQIFANAYKVVKGQDLVETALSAGNYPTSGSYIDVSKVERFHVLVHFGTIHGSDAPVVEIKQADAANGTLDVISATYAKHTADPGDDGEWVSFTIETDKLATDHHFVSAVVSAVANGSYGDIFYLLPEPTLPVTQTTAVLPTASQYAFVG